MEGADKNEKAEQPVVRKKDKYRCAPSLAPTTLLEAAAKCWTVTV